MSEKIIESIYVDQVGHFHSIHGKITEISKPGEMAMVPWYKATNDRGIEVEINGKYVIKVEYK